MSVYIIGISALFFWRHVAHPERYLSRRVTTSLLDTPKSPQELASFVLTESMFGPGPVHLAVPSCARRVSKRKYRYSVITKELPAGAFCDIGNGIYVASPEYCLLNAATELSLPLLIELCMEFGGFYSLAANEQGALKCRSTQLCTAQSLLTFTDGCKDAKGSKRLKEAISRMANRSRSPMETRVYLLISLPRKYGGFGLPIPFLNYQIDLDAKERAYAGRQMVECDFCWPDKKVAAEYDGQAFHESPEARGRDASKRNSLIARGYTVFTLTAKQACNEKAFEKAVLDIANALKYRLKSVPADWPARRENLRKELFASTRI